MKKSPEILYMILTRFENIKAITDDAVYAKEFIEMIGLDNCIVKKCRKRDLNLTKEDIDCYKLYKTNTNTLINFHLKSLLHPFVSKFIDRFASLCDELLRISDCYKIERETESFLTLSYYTEPYMYLELDVLEELFISDKIIKLYLETLKRTTP